MRCQAGIASGLRSTARNRGRLIGCLVALLLGGLSLEADPSEMPVLLFGIGVHVEPFGAKVSPTALAAGAIPRRIDPRQMDYTRRGDFERHADDLRKLAARVEMHGGRLTIQVQTPFTSSAVLFDCSLLADLNVRGHEIGLHFHENTHLGQGAEDLPPSVWTAVMREQLAWIAQAGVGQPVRFWSGGNLYPALFEAADEAGLSVNSDWKSPQTQSCPPELIDIHPWRPSGGTDGEAFAAITAHDPQGPVIFLPGGLIDPEAFADKRAITADGGLAAWLDVLEEAILSSLAASRIDRINACHITLHPGEFVGDPDDPYGLFGAFLETVIDPLVAEGRIAWATFSEMAEAFEAWEEEYPEMRPRP
jgi:hypothetical protein